MRHLTVIYVIKLGADQDDVILCLCRALLLENVDISVYCIKALLICQIKHDDSALAITKVATSEGEELLLPLRVPYLQPHSLVFHLKGKTLEIYTNRVHLTLFIELLINEANEKTSLPACSAAKHDDFELVIITTKRVNHGLIVL